MQRAASDYTAEDIPSSLGTYEAAREDCSGEEKRGKQRDGGSERSGGGGELERPQSVSSHHLV